MSEEQQTYTDEEADEIVRQYIQQGDKQSLYNFLNNVVKTKDTTKVGNLSEEELGMSKLPLRTYQELSLFCNNIAGMPELGSYFKQMGEIQLASSLSKNGFLVRASITTKKELADVSPKERKANSGWFGSRNKTPAPEGGAT